MCSAAGDNGKNSPASRFPFLSMSRPIFVFRYIAFRIYCQEATFSLRVGFHRPSRQRDQKSNKPIDRHFKSSEDQILDYAVPASDLAIDTHCKDKLRGTNDKSQPRRFAKSAVMCAVSLTSASLPL